MVPTISVVDFLTRAGTGCSLPVARLLELELEPA